MSTAQETRKEIISVSLLMPLSGYVVSPVLRLSASDSLTRLAYARNRVQTVTKLRIRPNEPVDSLEVVELDRRGNTVMTYEPKFKIRVKREYNSQDQVTQIIKLLPDSYHWLEEFDPQQKQYRAFQVNGPNTKQLVISASQYMQGDTVVEQTTRTKPVVVLGQEMSKTVGRLYHTGVDTLQYDILAYNQEDEIITTENLYIIRRRGLRVESGTISYVQAMSHLLATSAPARQWRSQGLSDAAIRQRLPHPLRPTYVPSDYSAYTKAGQLTLTTNQSLAKHKTQSNYGDSNYTTSSLASESASHRYAYDKKGHIIREEIEASFPAAEDHPASTLSVITERIFSSKGLLVSEKSTQDHQTTTHYEYRYTYF